MPLLAVCGVTVWLVVTGRDLAVSRFFFVPELENPWPFGQLPVMRLLYHSGCWPGLALAVCALLVALASWRVAALRPARGAAWFFVLLMVLGPGLLVNSLGKDHWGRPRPVQTVDFGGSREYSPPWRPTSYHPGKSFPSGHASVGFFLMAPFFVYRRKHRLLAGLWLLSGLAGGALMGVMRIAMGGHYLTDVLWSGTVVYLCGWWLAEWLLPASSGRARTAA